MTDRIFLFHCPCGCEYQGTHTNHGYPVNCECPNCHRVNEPYQEEIWNNAPDATYATQKEYTKAGRR